MLSQCQCSGNNGLNPFILIAIVAGIWVLFNWIKMLMKSKGVSFMNKAIKIVIVVVLIAVVGIVIAIKQQGKSPGSEQAVAANPDANTIAENTVGNSQNSPEAKKLPRLIDLGAGKCIPCKMMKPILDELRQDYKNNFRVIFIDVWENPDQAEKYNIKLIPTQIFYDSNGKELFRHEGFYSKEDILGKWKEFGINLEKGTQNESK